MAEGYDWGRGKKHGFSVFSVTDEVSFNRLGASVMLKGKDGTNRSSDSVEANLLYEILRALKKSK